MRVHIKQLTITLLICLTSACSNHQNTPNAGDIPDYKGPINTWSMRVSPAAGQLLITGTADQGTSTYISFSGKKKEPQYSLMEIELSDRDCEVGHQIKLSYKANANDSIFRYFENHIAWTSPYSILIKWNHTKVVITAQQESMEITTLGAFKHVKISSRLGNLNLEKIEYSSDPTTNLHTTKDF